ncbi:alkaline phosphatase family protein [Microbacterium hydrocarbonoxydans]|uniref:alkaline phosphatase family protein n=1 Tax=Microbacterium hydrocarbonoxydans TaxID=273678 RepID=UPI00203E2641|nr:alkaline phosphatase family protein [Microbacterium hydrocarbonoxydans]MCM3778704.1 alkaline phosphatase family protein [Microbacterium hydrocarbonoxydans]
MKLARTLGILVAGALAGTAAASAVPIVATAAVDPNRHVVVIGVDGLLFDKIAPANAPVLDSMIASGYSSTTSLYAAPMAQTLSGPGWATNLLGVWPDKHKVLGNSWTAASIAAYPDFLTRLENADRAHSTYAAVTWAPLINGSGGPGLITTAVDRRYVSTGDADTAANAASYLRDSAPNASFIHFDDVDHAGHSYGAASQQYLDAVAEIDGYIGQIRSAVASRPNAASESWTYIITSDHGHTDGGGHGGNTAAERSSFIIKTGPGVAKTTPAVAPKNVDIAADVLSMFGVAIPAEFDGRPLSATSTDPFDTRAGSLQGRVDETGIPSTTRGWTKSFPSGWSVDDSGMGTGGVTEWRGWSLTTDPFWTATERGQQRESNVRARGVFAVADSDEWSDKARTGTFNSLLTSQTYAVGGKSSATVSFVSHYRKEGAETASVLVSFDGGAWQNVTTYTGDRIAVAEKFTVAVPGGASSMRVRFSLTGGDNNWYWAVDDLRVG